VQILIQSLLSGLGGKNPTLAISKVLAASITLPNSFRFGQGIQSFVMTKAK